MDGFDQLRIRSAFSINLITLFALVLTIGIVVDNAIVVTEVVHAKMEQWVPINKRPKVS
ncbi:efflux RND transporter permease subunit [Methylicorpusculum oleiharenae]|nr:efflux RND transporter permease subunit [Methylicorpusculum oleiharenae]MCD2452888.1 efflux RND transporter permease subunit [Methylicorpusculum oleiharenae]